MKLTAIRTTDNNASTFFILFQNDSELEKKLPLLGDIPLLGDLLFTSTSKNNEEENLVVILTPYIIDKSEQLSKLQRDLGRLAQIQRKYNIEIFKKIEKNEDKENIDNGLNILNIDEPEDF